MKMCVQENRTILVAFKICSVLVLLGEHAEIVMIAVK